ncbi:unnamed protein product [Caenorhabditis sp. 36 PRJEB53466]|nr:unnamed protein product [Caenorhabditis sp. 36 PRJEB53466]
MTEAYFYLKCLVILSLIAACKSELTCARCAAGNFVTKQWLFQSNRENQLMYWTDFWGTTDCAIGKATMVACQSSCLTIVLQKHMPRGFVFDGMLMECADEMIISTPDLPGGINYTRFSENGLFFNTRHNYNITYIFKIDSVNEHEVALEYWKFYGQDIGRRQLRDTAILIFTIAFVTVVLLAVCYIAKVLPQNADDTDLKQLKHSEPARIRRFDSDGYVNLSVTSLYAARELPPIPAPALVEYSENEYTVIVSC